MDPALHLSSLSSVPRCLSGVSEVESPPNSVKARRDPTNWIVNAPSTLDVNRRYLANQGTPGCKAYVRSLAVTADGGLQSRSISSSVTYKLEDRSRMIEEFSHTNRSWWLSA